MQPHHLQTAEFESYRGHLWAVSYRMLGVASDADDAVQETWLRFHDANTDDIENLGGWLTTVTGRICLDLLRRRASRREAPLDDGVGQTPVANAAALDPEREAMLGDAVERAMLVVLETLTPPERLAFVLHDMFSMPFQEIAPIVGKSTLATRQLASRARRRLQAAQGDSLIVPVNRATNEDVVRDFMEATREGDFARLLTLLDPDVVMRADAVAVAMGVSAATVGAQEVAEFLSGRARAARVVLLNGLPGAVWFAGPEPRVAFLFTLTDGRVRGIELVADTERLAGVSIEPLSRPAE